MIGIYPIRLIVMSRENFLLYFSFKDKGDGLPYFSNQKKSFRLLYNKGTN